MKSKLLILSAVLFVLSINGYASDKVNISVELPAKSTAFIKRYFPQAKITKTKIDVKHTKVTTEVKLDNRVEIHFDQNDNVISIESKTKLPDAVIPAQIMAYVKKNYPKNSITSWEVKTKKQKIKLDNDVELIFDLKENFIKMDK